MRNLFSLIIFVSLFLSSAFASQGIWKPGSLTVNPGAGAVLAVTSALNSPNSTGAFYYVGVTCSATVAAICQLEEMNGGTVVGSIYFMVPANTSFQFNTGQVSIPIPNGYTLQVVSATAITGQMQASITYANDGGY